MKYSSSKRDYEFSEKFRDMIHWIKTQDDYGQPSGSFQVIMEWIAKYLAAHDRIEEARDYEGVCNIFRQMMELGDIINLEGGASDWPHFADELEEDGEADWYRAQTMKEQLFEEWAKEDSDE
jgi:hypothetical protein